MQGWVSYSDPGNVSDLVEMASSTFEVVYPKANQ